VYEASTEVWEARKLVTFRRTGRRHPGSVVSNETDKMDSEARTQHRLAFGLTSTNRGISQDDD
jgi:hypothetical protein